MKDINETGVTKTEFKAMVAKVQNSTTLLKATSDKLAEGCLDAEQFSGRYELLIKMTTENWVPLAVSDKSHRMPFAVLRVIKAMQSAVEGH